MNTSNELTLTADINNIAAATDFVNERLEAAGCGAKALMQIDVAIDELFGNIARYAYVPGTGEVTVSVDVAENTGETVITFTDGGRPYNPLEKEDPDVSLPADKREIGGLGIFLAKKFMDDMSYEYKDGLNILKIRKKLD